MSWYGQELYVGHGSTLGSDAFLTHPITHPVHGVHVSGRGHAGVWEVPKVQGESTIFTVSIVHISQDGAMPGCGKWLKYKVRVLYFQYLQYTLLLLTLIQ